MTAPRRPVDAPAERPRRSADWARKQLYAYPGYVRVPNPDKVQNGRSGQSGRKGSYKKGWELRLVVPAEELDEVRALIHDAGLPLAKPFFKGRQLIQPIYGYEPVAQFLEATGSSVDTVLARRAYSGAE